MPTPQPSNRMSDQEHEAMSHQGLAVYETKLKPILEPDHNNEYVAIHVESEEYALGKSSGDSMRAMRLLQPVGSLVIVHIGSEPEWGIAARVRADGMKSSASGLL